MADHVDRVLTQWAQERPDLDVSPMGVIGRLSRLSLIVNAELRRTFEDHGLDAASFDVLATLRRNGLDKPLTPAALMRSSMVTSGAITQRLDKLESRGLITRSRNQIDGRSQLIRLTEAGSALIDRALPDHLNTEDQLLIALDAEQREQLADLLRTVLESHGDADPTVPAQPTAR
ncbi:MarR family winged helix-turn-helix transcriptional regulator [Natronoglycomyces albus]|uniref:MarR family transcriptional regulator n=1 Tax=Natronoglycomyces albus TaxID=2811108 RepID=A0A895XMC9_9ACTN|nr:MarR family transcriptional regulator [Natronoglycomyces albus]QSB04922.1 MarR family transcriptional regulator [Natronoglycomyces albus]